MKKLFFSLLTILLVMLLYTPALAAQNGAFTYEIKGNGTATITKYNYAMHKGEDIYIPRMLDGYTVTEIGEQAFTTLRLDSNKVPDGNYCAYEAKSLVIPDTVTTIGAQAFMGVKFQTYSISIPSSVLYIGPGAFSGLFNIQQFVVDPSNPVYASIDGVLYNKQKKELVAFPANYPASRKDTRYFDFVIPEGITSIGDFAFWGYSWTNGIQLPSTLEKIGNYSFAYAHNSRIFDSLVSSSLDPSFNKHIITFPASVEQLGTGAFYKLVHTMTVLNMRKTSISEIPPFAFYSDAFGSYDLGFTLGLPSNLLSIGDSAFMNSSFNGGNNYVHIALPASTHTIGQFAFSNTKGNFTLECLIKSASLTIGEKAFMNSAIKGIVIPTVPTTIGYKAFDTSQLTSLTFKGSITELPAAFNNCKNMKWIKIYGSVKAIGPSAFNNCTALTDVTIYDGVESISDYAFYNCTSLQNITIPSSVTSIGKDIADKTRVSIHADFGTYAALWATENGYILESTDQEDTSWLLN